MADNTPIEGLMDDMLLEIFSYLDVKDLVGSVQHVSSHWSEVCSSSRLWNNVTYKPERYENEEVIINFLKDAPKLTSINLSQVHITPKVIETLAHNCSNLKTLVLREVKALSHESLREVQRNCHSLAHLTVADSVFNDPKMEEVIATFQNLKSLTILQRPYFSKLINLRQIAEGCPKLEHLEMSEQIPASNEFQYFLDKKKDQLKFLRIICWTKNDNCVLPLLSTCSQLNTLYINLVCDSDIDRLQLPDSFISLTTFGWSHLGSINVEKIMSFFRSKKLRQLWELKLSHYDNFEDRLVDVIIDCCPLLRKLHLPDCWDLTDESLKHLNRLKYLQSVDFRRSNVSDRGVTFLNQCEQLQHIDVGFTNITGRALLAMTRLSKLKILILDGNSGIQLEIIPTHLQALRKLSIRYCHEIEKESIQHLKNERPQLQVDQ